jgi:transcriptional regulator with XRE-family HTH domain
MNGDPIERLPIAFGRVLARRRSAKPGTALALAGAVGLTENEVIAMERGQREPVLTEFFRIARASGDPPTILLIDVITTWLDADTLHATRAADFTRLYRLDITTNPETFESWEPRTTPCPRRGSAPRFKNSAAIVLPLKTDGTPCGTWQMCSNFCGRSSRKLCCPKTSIHAGSIDRKSKRDGLTLH